MRYDKILVDGMNLYHRAYGVSTKLVSKLEDGTEMITGGIYTSLTMLKKLIRNYLTENGQIFVLFEGTYSKQKAKTVSLRRQIDPEYKANRTVHDSAFYKSLELLELMLLSYSSQIIVSKVPGYEADDLVKPLVENFREEETVLLVSTDLDWARFIRENVHWLKKNTLIDMERFEDNYGFPPSEETLGMYKAFRGDASDNIPIGVPQIAEKLLVAIINECESLREVYENLEEYNFIGDTWKDKILENRGRVLLNYHLVESLSLSLKELEAHLYPASFEPEKLNAFYQMLGFNTSQFDPRITVSKKQRIEEFLAPKKIQRV